MCRPGARVSNRAGFKSPRPEFCNATHREDTRQTRVLQLIHVHTRGRQPPRPQSKPKLATRQRHYATKYTLRRSHVRGSEDMPLGTKQVGRSVLITFSSVAHVRDRVVRSHLRARFCSLHLLQSLLHLASCPYWHASPCRYPCRASCDGFMTQYRNR